MFYISREKVPQSDHCPKYLKVKRRPMKTFKIENKIHDRFMGTIFFSQFYRGMLDDDLVKSTFFCRYLCSK